MRISVLVIALAGAAAFFFVAIGIPLNLKLVTRKRETMNWAGECQWEKRQSAADAEPLSDLARFRRFGTAAKGSVAFAQQKSSSTASATTWHASSSRTSRAIGQLSG